MMNDRFDFYRANTQGRKNRRQNMEIIVITCYMHEFRWIHFMTSWSIHGCLRASCVCLSLWVCTLSCIRSISTTYLLLLPTAWDGVVARITFSLFHLAAICSTHVSSFLSDFVFCTSLKWHIAKGGWEREIEGRSEYALLSCWALILSYAGTHALAHPYCTFCQNKVYGSNIPYTEHIPLYTIYIWCSS